MTGWGHKDCVLLVLLDCSHHSHSSSTTPIKSTKNQIFFKPEAFMETFINLEVTCETNKIFLI